MLILVEGVMRKKVISYREICFERHFDGDDQKNAILAPLITTMIQAEQNIHSGSFNNAEQFSSMSLLKRSTV